MREIFLHIGPPKTGSSAIQTFLRLNAKLLETLGYHVPLKRNRKGMNHHALVRSLVGLSLLPKERLMPEDVITDLKETPAHTALISTEDAAGILLTKKAGRRLVDALQSTGAHVTLVMYARNQPQLLNSAYSQNVKAFRFAGSFESFVESALSRPSVHFESYLDMAAQRGVRIRPRAYSRQVRDAGIVGDYLDAVGVQRELASVTGERVNELVGPFAIEAARQVMADLSVRGLELNRLQKRACRLALDEVLREAAIKDARYCGLTSQMARKIEGNFAESNDRFADAAWHKLWQEVFPDEIGLEFESNDYDDIGVPQKWTGEMTAVVRKLGEKALHIAADEKLAAFGSDP